MLSACVQRSGWGPATTPNRVGPTGPGLRASGDDASDMFPISSLYCSLRGVFEALLDLFEGDTGRFSLPLLAPRVARLVGPRAATAFT